MSPSEQKKKEDEKKKALEAKHQRQLKEEEKITIDFQQDIDNGCFGDQ